MESLLGDEVYHYHHKMILKEPRIGGAWTWHQDYGYWYNNGCLLPDMASCMFAVDRATKENGCLQVVRGSHHMGRIDHIKRGDQTGSRHGTCQCGAPAYGTGSCGNGPGFGSLVSRQYVASLRSESERESSLGIHLLL
jgi:hypothetical protein